MADAAHLEPGPEVPTAREVRAEIRDWRRGRAELRWGEVLSDGYIAIFCVVMIGAMGGNVVLTLRRLADDTCAGSCTEVRSAMPWLVALAVALLALGLARLLGPVFSPPAANAWLLSTPRRPGRAAAPGLGAYVRARRRGRRAGAARPGRPRRLLPHRGCGVPGRRRRHRTRLRRHRRALAGAREPGRPGAHLGDRRGPLGAAEPLGDPGRRSGAERAARRRSRGRRAPRRGRGRAVLADPLGDGRRLATGPRLHRAPVPQPLRRALVGRPRPDVRRPARPPLGTRGAASDRAPAARSAGRRWCTAT